jgi:hypothetical protein
VIGLIVGGIKYFLEKLEGLITFDLEGCAIFLIGIKESDLN